MFQQFDIGSRIKKMEFSLSKAKLWLLSFVDSHSVSQSDNDNRGTKVEPVALGNKTDEASTNFCDMRRPMSYRWSIDSGCVHQVLRSSTSGNVDSDTHNNNLKTTDSSNVADNRERKIGKFESKAARSTTNSSFADDSKHSDSYRRRKHNRSCSDKLQTQASPHIARQKQQDSPYLARLKQSIPTWVVTDDFTDMRSSITSDMTPRMSIGSTQEDTDAICSESLLSTADLLSQVHERLQGESPVFARKNSNVFDCKPCIKMSLQYFSSSNNLRVILIKSKNLSNNDNRLSAKMTLYHGSERKKKCSKLMSLRDLAKGRNDILFDDIDLENETTWTLRVKLYHRRRFLLRTKCLGQVNISLDDFDLFLNTKIWCLLGKESSVKQMTKLQKEEYRIVSADESISATAKASLSMIDLVLTPSTYSLPHLSPHSLKRINTAPCRRRNRIVDELVPRNWSSSFK